LCYLGLLVYGKIAHGLLLSNPFAGYGNVLCGYVVKALKLSLFGR
jgi:hypothetical protein